MTLRKSLGVCEGEILSFTQSGCVLQGVGSTPPPSRDGPPVAPCGICTFDRERRTPSGVRSLAQRWCTARAAHTRTVSDRSAIAARSLGHERFLPNIL